MPEITSAGADQADAAIAVLSDAFFDDPAMNWIMPRPDLYPRFFNEVVKRVYLPKGFVDLESEGRGAALWLPPGEVFEPPRNLALLSLMARVLLSCGPSFLRNLSALTAQMEAHHPRDDHYYLQFVGCGRAYQGQGVGSALLKAGTRRADEAGLPAYLESSNIRNVPLYQRHGFEVTQELQMPRGGPPMWCMLRPAR